MANLLYPHKSGEIFDLQGDWSVPYIVGDDGEYIRGFNLYLQERCTGRVLPSGETFTVAAERPSSNTIHAIGHRLLNFTSWLYCTSAHPTEGLLNWADVQEWHVDELYREAMVLGFWTEEYFWTGQKQPLNYNSTIGPRIKEVLSCYRWMAAEGLIDQKRPYTPFGPRQRAAASARASLKAVISSALQNHPLEKKFSRRSDPGDWSPLSSKELKALLKCLKLKPIKFAFILYFMTGMRLSELIDNMLLPGTMYERSTAEQRKARFPEGPYLLKYDNSDYRMVGVIPSTELVFAKDPPRLLSYRVLGKNKKIRKVWVLSSFWKKLWKYRLIAEGGAGSQSKLLLNTEGQAITQRVVEYHIAMARKAAEALLGHPIPVTPHVLRHTFACYFLEANIASAATKAGLDPHNLTRKQIEDFGADVIPVLQELLGHVYIEHTVRYLRQLANGKLGLQYLKVFAAAIEEALDDDV
ncbi:recombinase XerD [Rhizobium ruizarguesonis]|uniref:recombinase XerD n=1 Tax=Rhizobium ruizarguesonis TaxID=2081791 RepID=UPI001030E841|nr:recombinase XerD [Rhizobium ruizarguesonis]TAZ73928.1 recombinase XerD [Rhizobium ruizarguesonis]TBA00530.1 recombinase XerD [Rhizobium ruizarguesonis]